MAGYDAIRRAQIEAVGGRFLRARPWVTGVGAGLNAALLASSAAPAPQRLALGSATGALVLAFSVEAWLLRRRDPEGRWLALSLCLTALALGLACLMSGGATSPLLPILFAPVAIGLAAFGTRGAGAAVVAVASLALVGLLPSTLGLAPLPFPALPPITAERMTLVSAAVSITLVTLGVSRLADAHRDAGLALERTRAGLLDDALARASLAESTGLRVAHEIRTPLTSIKALVALVARADLDPRNQRRLEVALTEIARMEALVSDYLSLARPLEALQPKAIDALALAHEVASVLEGSARDAGVAVRVEGTAASLVADPRRVREALLNLGSNAIHAMRASETRVLTLRVAENGGGARIEVIDTGPGIDASAGAPLTTGRAGGMGLGILLARGVAAQHGGALHLEGQPGRGTRAVLELAARPPSDETEREDEANDGHDPDRR